MANTDGLMINLEGVRTAASNMRSVNGSLKSKLDEISGYMNCMDSNEHWDSDTEDYAIDKFNQMANKKFPEFYDKIDQYVKLLENTVIPFYESNEATLKTVADSINGFNT